jgi:hypothetical protein
MEVFMAGRRRSSSSSAVAVSATPLSPRRTILTPWSRPSLHLGGKFSPPSLSVSDLSCSYRPSPGLATSAPSSSTCSEGCYLRKRINDGGALASDKVVADSLVVEYRAQRPLSPPNRALILRFAPWTWEPLTSSSMCTDRALILRFPPWSWEPLTSSSMSTTCTGEIFLTPFLILP